MYSFSHLVQFYETDLMRIVHHSNYLRFFEEARVAWAHQVGLIDYQKPDSASLFAVIETQVRHVKPSFFGDLLTIDLEVKNEGVKVLFQYRICKNDSKAENRAENAGAAENKADYIVALGKSVHVPLSPEYKPMKLSKDMQKILKGEKWTEIWL